MHRNTRNKTYKNLKGVIGTFNYIGEGIVPSIDCGEGKVLQWCRFVGGRGRSGLMDRFFFSFRKIARSGLGV